MDSPSSECWSVKYNTELICLINLFPFDHVSDYWAIELLCSFYWYCWFMSLTYLRTDKTYVFHYRVTGIEFCGRYKRATCNTSQKWKRLWLGKFPRKNPDDQQVGFIHKHRVILISHRLATWRNMDGRPE